MVFTPIGIAASQNITHNQSKGRVSALRALRESQISNQSLQKTRDLCPLMTLLVHIIAQI